MPINRKLMTELKKKYGSVKGEDVYYAMETKRNAKNAKRKSNGSKKAAKRSA